MMSAAPGAIYVWCNDRLEYPKSLAKELGRGDLQIVGADWLKDRWHGRRDPVVLDHAFAPTRQTRDALSYFSIKGQLVA